MDRALSVWNMLDMRRRVIVIGATIAMFAAVLLLGRAASSPNMALLYSGLEPTAAGEVVAALEAQGVVHEVRGAGIFVDASQRDSLRLTLAGEGLPANGTAGYELLDSLSGFGTTSQMFDAAYWRAKEGELARTIVAARHITAARVHIATPGTRPFARDERVTASVTVTTASGALSAPHAKALRYLVASAVPGLVPENVSIIDSAGGLVASGSEIPGTSDGLPLDRAATLRRNAERLLEARVGYGNAVVEVSVETVTESEVISERRFDPDSRFAISTETEERSDSATDTAQGAVTVASNLPDGDAGGNDRQSNSTSTETRERVNFEVSETQREVSRAPGDIRRLTVAVLVDGVRGIDDSGGETWEPRSEEELQNLRDLVASAVGFSTERGDTLTIKSLEFEPVVEVGSVATGGFLDRAAVNPMTLIQTGVLAVVALVLGLFVLRPILAGRPAGAPAADAPGGRLPPFPLPPISPPAALDGEIDDGFDLPGNLPVVAGYAGPGDRLAAKGPEDAVARLRRMIDDRQDEAVELLRSWMDDPERRA
ncbi:flagellar basal-body MS-ring/collar protein FliF [Palleronia sp. KMU-117]|uniref:flagellar basal-body MS-ring/collar protein FliF n=1 Tax=Palleronia sp. KMU-117 TaxID=3434108 RepID=UPI003D709F67